MELCEQVSDTWSQGHLLREHRTGTLLTGSLVRVSAPVKTLASSPL